MTSPVPNGGDEATRDGDEARPTTTREGERARGRAMMRGVSARMGR